MDFVAFKKMRIMCVQTEIEKIRKKAKLPLFALQELESFLHEFKCPNKNELPDDIGSLHRVVLPSRSSLVRSVPSVVVTAFTMTLALPLFNHYFEDLMSLAKVHTHPCEAFLPLCRGGVIKKWR